MLTCKNVAEEATDYLERKMSLWERIRFRLHLFVCGNCTLFVHRIGLTSQFSGKAAHQVASSEEILAVMSRIHAAEKTQSPTPDSDPKE